MQSDDRSERALSEEPTSSYDEDVDMRSDRDEEDGRQLLECLACIVWILTECKFIR